MHLTLSYQNFSMGLYVIEQADGRDFSVALIRPDDDDDDDGTNPVLQPGQAVYDGENSIVYFMPASGSIVWMRVVSYGYNPSKYGLNELLAYAVGMVLSGSAHIDLSGIYNT